MDLKNFEAMVKGTILEEVMAVDLADLNAENRPKNKVEDKDAVLGTMNDLEKRLYLLIRKKKELVRVICKDCKEDRKSDDEKKALCDQFHKINNQTLQITALMWRFIEMRLGSGKMFVREGFQIESEQDNGPDGFHVIEIGFGDRLTGPFGDALRRGMP